MGYELTISGITVENLTPEQAEILKKCTDRKEFNYSQVLQLVHGLSEGIDISIYADPEFNDRQMDEIRRALKLIEYQRTHGLENLPNINLLARKDLDDKQMSIIRYAFAQEVPNEKIALFADPKYNYEQMDQIRAGILRDIDITSLLDPNLSAEEMEEKRWELENQKEQEVKEEFEEDGYDPGE